jgi:hypothetical protein
MRRPTELDADKLAEEGFVIGVWANDPESSPLHTFQLPHFRIAIRLSETRVRCVEGRAEGALIDKGLATGGLVVEVVEEIRNEPATLWGGGGDGLTRA